MKDQAKTTGQLVSELQELRQRVAELEVLEVKYQQTHGIRRKCEQEFIALAENASDIVARFDEQLRHLYINPAAERATGIPRQEFIGRTNRELGAPPELVLLWGQTTRAVFKSGQEKALEYEMPTLRGPRYFEARLAPEFAADGSVESVLAISRDITERIQAENELREYRDRLGELVKERTADLHREITERARAEQALRQLNRNLLLLDQVGREIAATLDQFQITEQLLQVITEIVAAAGASVWLWEERPTLPLQPHEEAVQDWLVCRAASPHDQGGSPLNMRIRPAQGVVGWVVRTGKSAIVPCAPDDPRFFAGVDEQTGFRTLSLLAVPLWVRGKIIGALEAVNKLDGDFDEQDLALLETLAASAAIAIDNAGLVEALGRRTVELQVRTGDLEREVVERARAEEALHAAHQRLLDIIEFLPDATFVIDHESKVIAWNRAIEELTGVRQEDVIGEGDYAYAVPFYGACRPMLIDLVRTAAPDIEATYDYLERRDGVLYAEEFVPFLYEGVGAFLWSTASPLLDQEGRYYGAMQSIRNVTERALAEQELRRHREHLAELVEERTAELVTAREQAEAANQAKSVFLARMGHELRTPLNAVLGYAQIFRRRPLDPDVIKGLNVVQQSGEHLLTLINDILDIAKMETGKLELHRDPIYLPAFLETIAGVVGLRAQAKGLTFHFDTPPEGLLPTWVQADETRLRQVLLNLLDNAVKFTPAGQVTLRVSSKKYEVGSKGEPQEPAFLLPTPRFASLLRFEVQDTGVGISPDQLERIFQPFEQLGDVLRHGGGMGVDLTISRHLLQLMGSDLHVQSPPAELDASSPSVPPACGGEVKGGPGSRFWFEVALPLTETAPEAAPPPAQPITGYKGPRRTLLVVDDVSSNRMVLVDLLGPLGFEVFEAVDGQQAIHLAQETRPDLILMDRWMPVLDGFEAARQMRQIPGLAGVVIITVSASMSEQDQAQSREAGIDAFLPKPVSWPRLAALLEEHLGLEWEYEGQGSEGAAPPPPPPHTPTPLVPPPEEELAVLHDLARMGDMEAIQERATHIEALGEQYVPFAHRLRELAQGFEERQILALVVQYLEAQQ